MGDKLGVAVIGYGFMGTTHLSAWKLVEEAEIKAVMGRTLPKVKEVAEKFNATAYNNLEDILKRDDIDIIDICTPTYTHAKYAVSSMNAGKHVLCEKPMALSLKEADEMINASKRNKVKLMIAHVLRFFPEYMKAKELVDNGSIGEPVIARAYRGGPMPTWSPWFTEKEKSGGIAIDLAIHDVDFLIWAFNKDVEKVYAKVDRLIHKDVSAEDFALITMKFNEGGIALVEASWALPQRFPFTMKLEIDGTEGMISLDNQSTVPVKLITNESVEGFSPETLPWRPSVHPFPIDPYYREIKHFIESILKDKPPMTDGEVSKKSLAVCLAALKSSETNSPIMLREV